MCTINQLRVEYDAREVVVDWGIFLNDIELALFEKDKRVPRLNESNN